MYTSKDDASFKKLFSAFFFQPEPSQMPLGLAGYGLSAESLWLIMACSGENAPWQGGGDVLW